MPLIEIVGSSQPSLDRPFRSAVETPVLGELFEGPIVEFRGWFVTERSGTKIEIARNGSVVCSLEIDQVRPDVREVFPEASERCGFLGRASIEGWSENLFEVRAVFPSRAAVSLGSIRARRMWREDADRGSPPFVSIVIRASRATPEASASVESALGQTYPHIEVLVVGHPEQEVRGFGSRGVRSVEAEEKGVARLNNLGIRRSVGDFLLFLGQEERLVPNAVQSAVDAFRNHPEAGIVVVDGDSGFAAFRRSAFETVGVFDAAAGDPEAELIARFGESYPVLRQA